MNQNQRIIFFLLLLMFLLSILVYSRMPLTIVVHWGINGKADGYSGKMFGLFFLPILSILMFGILAWLPNLDPKRKNIELFRSTYEGFLVLFFLFFFYLHLLTILWNLGMRISFNQAFAPALSVLFYGMGILIEKAKMNYFIGIRTPWTLSNEEVWDETHKKSGIAFKISAIISFFGFFFPYYYLWIMLTTILFATIYSIMISYFIYKRVTKTNN
jgi:uncharacterized membrane protein